MQILKRLTSLIKANFVYNLNSVNIDATVRRVFPRRILILCYHGVIENPNLQFCWTNICLKNLRLHLEYLKEHYHVLSMSELLKLMESSKPVPDNAAVITFDDGFESIKTLVFPLLRNISLPATVYIPTGIIGTRKSIWTCELFSMISNTRAPFLEFNEEKNRKYRLETVNQRSETVKAISYILKRVVPDKRKFIMTQISSQIAPEGIQIDPCFNLLNWQDINELMESGFLEFQPHTVNHEILSNCSEEIQRREILDSILTLEKKTNRKCTSFAFPNGQPNDIPEYSLTVLKKTHLLGALTTIYGFNKNSTDRYYMRRICVGSEMDLSRFKCAIAGISSLLL